MPPEKEKASRPTYRRRKVLVDPKFQLTVTGYFAGLALIAVGVLFWSIHLIFSDLLNMIQLSGSRVSPASVTYLHALETRTVILLSIGACVVFAMLTIGGVILSFHIAGPIYRLRAHMRNLIAGNQNPVFSTRKGDFFPELAQDYNHLLEHLRTKR